MAKFKALKQDWCPILIALPAQRVVSLNLMMTFVNGLNASAGCGLRQRRY
ncbi:MAG: hypothetical protein ACRD97_10465 [Nitrososphaeraceae archaeon]